MEGNHPVDSVLVYDTTLRDGEQAPGMSMQPQEKLRFAHQLARLHVDVIEAGFPAASETESQAVRAIGEQVGESATIAALARCEPADIVAAGRSLALAERRRIHTFIAVSDLHIEAKLRSTREAVLRRAVEAVGAALEFTDDVQLGLEDASRADAAFVGDVVEAVVAAGASTVDVADTVGYVVPREFAALVAALCHRAAAAGGAVVSVHCHDDLGMAVANSLAGVEAGARQVDCAVNGIGERAGNASLEEVVMALATRRHHYALGTGVRTEELVRTSELLSEITDVPVPPNKAVVGMNAFAHEAGIHQHGVLANPLTYEIMTPADVGAAQRRLVLGKHSGRHAVRSLLEAHGLRLAPAAVDAAVAWVKRQAEVVGSIEADDLVRHVRDGDAPGASLGPVPTAAAAD